MLQVEPDGRYADVLERALYNGVLSGVSLDGRRFFYVNPLASDGGHHRQDWFGCACCPPNIARLLASLGSYIYGASDDGLYVHLYVAGSGATDLGGQRVALTQATSYPQRGEVKLTLKLEEPATFDLMLRIPGWCPKHKLKINGQRVGHRVVAGYARLRREWTSGDRIELTLDMPVERVAAHPRVAEDVGKVALRRGPVVYCLEQCDHAADVRTILLPDDARLTARHARDLFGGTVVIEGTGRALSTAGWDRHLYRPAHAAGTRRAKIRAVPYCLWDNREPGPMTVWMPRG
jgi:hypothetical protein